MDHSRPPELVHAVAAMRREYTAIDTITLLLDAAAAIAYAASVTEISTADSRATKRHCVDAVRQAVADMHDTLRSSMLHAQRTLDEMS